MMQGNIEQEEGEIVNDDAAAPPEVNHIVMKLVLFETQIAL